MLDWVGAGQTAKKVGWECFFGSEYDLHSAAFLDEIPK